jgi:hypothetical protein
VDEDDLAHLMNCATRATIAQNEPSCASARLDGDTDVDMDDFGIFQRCYSGKHNPADPACINP